MDKQHLTVLTLLDFSQAFNSVDFEILLSLLKSINISPPAIDWFRSYLIGRRQRIMNDDQYSSWCNLVAGVPQGGVLSPLLFAIFINSLTPHITSLYHMYADDLQIYTHSDAGSLPEAIRATNTDLASISKWSTLFGIQINPRKSQVIIIGSPQLRSKISWADLPPVHLNGIVIPYSSEVKNLGITFDEVLSWVPQVKAVSKRVFAAANSLKRLSRFLPIPTKVMLAQSLLLPLLDYADSCYTNLSEDQLNKLERLQNFCIRFIYGLRKFDHVSEFRKKLKWLPIRLRRNAHTLHLLYSILFHPSTPSYLKSNFHYLASESYTLRSSNNFLLRFPVHGSKLFGTSFTVSGIRLWNALPETIRGAQTIRSLLGKKCLKTTIYLYKYCMYIVYYMYIVYFV
ncbi:unnamed protein product [Colias eurytheme]|nr:unnamed protein product [Colias eurytheme]